MPTHNVFMSFYRTKVSLGSGLWVSASLTPYKTFLKLCWCDSGWWWYQLNTIDDANIKQSLQGWAGMTFEGSGTGTGIENFIPKVWEREGNWKFHSQNSGTGREWKNPFPKFGNGKGMKKGIPEIREREGNEKKRSQNSGTGIRGYYSREWTGTGTGMEWKNYDD